MLPPSTSAKSVLPFFSPPSPLVPLNRSSHVVHGGNHLGVGGQSQQREILPVQVIAQIENAGKPGASKRYFFPRTVFFLGLQQIGNAPDHRIATSICRGQQAQY